MGLMVGEQFAKSVSILRARLLNGDCRANERIGMEDSGTIGSESLAAFLATMNKVSEVFPMVTYVIMEDPERTPDGDFKVTIHTTGMATDLLVFFLLCATSGALEYAG